MNKFVLKILLVSFVMFCTTFSFADDSINSIINVNVFGNVGPAFSKMMDIEHELTEYSVPYSDGEILTDRPGHTAFSYGIYVDLMPFGVYSSEESTNAVLMGFRVKYAKNIVDQSVSVGDDTHESESKSENYMTYQSLLGGLALYYTPSYDNGEISGDSGSNYVVSVFVLFGKIMDGTITPIPLLQKDNNTDITSAFDGTRLELGLGYEYSWNSAVHIGFNCYYGKSWIKTKDKVYTEIDNSTSFADVSLEFYAGISI